MMSISSKVQALALAAGVLSLTAGPVGAANVSANVAIDLGTAITGSAWTGFAHPLDAPVTVNSGDTVTINISFAPNQQLTWAGDGFFNPWLILAGYPNGQINQAQTGWFAWSNLSVAFLGLTQGGQFDSQFLVDGDSGLIHLGPTFVLDGNLTPRSFTGVSVTFDATFLDGGMVRDYATLGIDGVPLFEGTLSWSGPAIRTEGGNEAVAVHEPGGLALLGSALMALGMVQRRRRAG